ncbi:hypothetical protein [Flavobacterium sp. '19STA2R22 D10 B1']|uniref:hypothetical protein n=1 Tax=Flavobacterium aerium TaxID=3037261 RepID=UPI00278C786E|nr:hypothetical protein [Flavobacterium sp. '19STA2R22 D10 B1']
MDHTTYDFFIRRCWDCDRFKHGANTDTWEDLLIKHYNFKNATVGNFKITQKEFENKLENVKAYLDKAYNKLIATANKKKVDQQVIEQLLRSREEVAILSEPKEIFDTLKVVFSLMNANNL